MSLEEKLQPSRLRIGTADTVGRVSYSIVIGAFLDYLTGLDTTGMIASRATATIINSFTSAPYGWWREKVYVITGTKDNHSKLRKGIVEWAAFTTFEIPVYASAVSTGIIAQYIISDKPTEWLRVLKGVWNLSKLSPMIALTMNPYMDFIRKLFGVPKAARGAYKSNV